MKETPPRPERLMVLAAVRQIEAGKNSPGRWKRLGAPVSARGVGTTSGGPFVHSLAHTGSSTGNATDKAGDNGAIAGEEATAEVARHEAPAVLFFEAAGATAKAGGDTALAAEVFRSEGGTAEEGGNEGPMAEVEALKRRRTQHVSAGRGKL